MREAKLITVPQWRPPAGPGSRGPAVAAVLLAACALLVAAYVTSGNRLVPVALPLIPLIVYVAARRPALAVLGVMVVTGFPATLQVHANLPITRGTELLLAAVWLSVVGGYLLGSRPRATWLWPGLIGPAIYLLLTLAQLLTSDSFASALESVRVSTWYLATGVLIALAPWPRHVYVTIARGAVVVALAVGAYALFRYIAGPSGAEETLARQTSYGFGLPGSAELRFFASFAFAGELSAWTSTVIPFMLALGMGLRGRWAGLALTAVGLCAFALLASEVRRGLVAALVGAVFVALVFGAAQSFASGRRIAVSLAASLAILVGGAGLYAVTIGSDEASSSRYERLLDRPTDDPTYGARLARWEAALTVAREEPFGHGLGTQGKVGSNSESGPVGTGNLDSSYLKIGIEQGLFVMGLFIVALLSLLVWLALFAARTPDRTSAILATGACGTLVAAMVNFYASITIEGIFILPAWILVGIGVAQATTRPGHGRRANRAEQAGV